MTTVRRSRRGCHNFFCSRRHFLCSRGRFRRSRRRFIRSRRRRPFRLRRGHSLRSGNSLPFRIRRSHSIHFQRSRVCRSASRHGGHRMNVLRARRRRHHGVLCRAIQAGGRVEFTSSSDGTEMRAIKSRIFFLFRRERRDSSGRPITVDSGRFSRVVSPVIAVLRHFGTVVRDDGRHTRFERGFGRRGRNVRRRGRVVQRHRSGREYTEILGKRICRNRRRNPERGHEPRGLVRYRHRRRRIVQVRRDGASRKRSRRRAFRIRVIVRRHDARAVDNSVVQKCALARLARQTRRTGARVSVHAVHTRTAVFAPLTFISMYTHMPTHNCRLSTYVARNSKTLRLFSEILLSKNFILRYPRIT